STCRSGKCRTASDRIESMLHGELVTLRAYRPSDLDLLTAFQNDLETELFGGGAPPSPKTREAIGAMWDRRGSDPNAWSYVIESDGKLIGDCGLFDANAVDRTAQLGIGIGDHHYWGRGYGTEAVRLLTDYGFRLRNLRKICL